jgi:hypothetical protein
MDLLLRWHRSALKDPKLGGNIRDISIQDTTGYYLLLQQNVSMIVTSLVFAAVKTTKSR